MLDALWPSRGLVFVPTFKRGSAEINYAASRFRYNSDFGQFELPGTARDYEWPKTKSGKPDRSRKMRREALEYLAYLDACAGAMYLSTNDPPTNLLTFKQWRQK